MEKGGQGAHDIFRRGRGALALDDGAYDPLLFKKGGIYPTTNKTLKGHSYHLIFHIKRSSGVHADRNIKDSYWGYAIIKTRRRKNGLTFSVCE